MESFGIKAARKRILKLGAIPTIFKRKQTTFTTEQTAEGEEPEIKQKQPRRAALEKLTRKRVSLHESET